MPTNKCSVLKRIYAFLIDFVLVLITSLVFEMVCSVPLFNVCFSFQDKCNTLIVEQVKTGLYYFVDENFVIVAHDENTEEEIISCYQQKKTLYDVKTLVYQKNDLYKSDFYLSSLDKFNYLYDESNFINNEKGKSGLFSYIDNQYVFKEDVSEKKKIEFCDEILKNTNKAFNVYKDGKINNLLNEVSILRIGSKSFGYFIMTLIFLFIIPLCNKYKATIGQLILKLSVVDKYYVYAGWSFLLLRYLSIFIFEIMVGIFTFGIVPLISFAMMLILRNGYCLHDLISFTQVVDRNEFEPFNNLKEYKDFIDEEKENTDKSLRKPYES